MYYHQSMNIFVLLTHVINDLGRTHAFAIIYYFSNYNT